MRQDPEEPFRTFTTHMQGKAESCELKTDYHGTCSGCQAAYDGNVYYNVYYTDKMVRDSMQKKLINEVITFI